MSNKTTPDGLSEARLGLVLSFDVYARVRHSMKSGVRSACILLVVGTSAAGYRGACPQSSEPVLFGI